jgi:GTPase SAR1 family protein
MRIATERERPDLNERLDKARKRLGAKDVTTAIVGEFKRGKSTLINALIQTSVCPVDADIVTAVPTLVKYGEQLMVTAFREQPDKPGVVAQIISFDDLTDAVSETTGDTQDNVRSVEVQVPHRILRSGLRLLDTPGVGGLDSVHGQVTLGSLNGVDGVLFVTDASQELTDPELQFLKTVKDRCPTIALVVTKTDLYRHWRKIVELNRGHLATAGLDVPVIPVSSLLRLRAAGQPNLNHESGFGPLVEFLARDVVQQARARVAVDVAHEVDFAASQLAHESDAERVVLAQPERGPEVVEKLQGVTGRARALSAPGAGWQQLLMDGISQLALDVEFDLQARLRKVERDVREIIDQSDPRDTWMETGAWLRRQCAEAGVANRDLLVTSATDLAGAVSAKFNLEAGDAVDVEFDLVTHQLRDLELPSASTLSMPGGRLASLLVTARTAAILPLFGASVVGFVPAGFVFLGAALLGSTTLGVWLKLIVNEKGKQRSYRQGQAKAAAARFVNEMTFELNKQTRDSLLRTQHRLRDEFQARAMTIQASATGAYKAARRASSLSPAAQAERTSALDTEASRLVGIRRDMRELAGAGAKRG